MNRTLQSWPYPRHEDFEAPLKQAAADWFSAKKYPVRRGKPYILDSRKNWHLNIIVPEVADHIEREISARKQQFALHKWVHHGLSSQALLFNLVGPLVVDDDFAPLRDALAQMPQSLPALPWSATFEFEDREVFNEKQRQPTSVDLVIEGKGGSAPFIECKFIEREFGGCSVYADGDCPGANPIKPSRDYSSCYLHCIGRKYWDLMDEYGLVAGPILTDSQCILANHYQFFRELLFALEHDGQFVLLHDERSPTFCFHGPHGDYGLMPPLLQMLPDDIRRRVGIVSIQRVVEHVKASGRHQWVGEFEAKYDMG